MGSSTKASKARVNSGKGGTPEPTVLQINVNGVLQTIDPNSLTLRERQICKVELTKLGYEPDELDIISATIWVIMRRSDPDLTFEDVCEGITIQDLQDTDELMSGTLLDLDPDDPEE